MNKNGLYSKRLVLFACVLTMAAGPGLGLDPVYFSTNYGNDASRATQAKLVHTVNQGIVLPAPAHRASQTAGPAAAAAKPGPRMPTPGEKTTSDDMSEGLRRAVTAALERDAHAIRAAAEGDDPSEYRAVNRTNGLSFSFDRRGVGIAPRGRLSGLTRALPGQSNRRPALCNGLFASAPRRKKPHLFFVSGAGPGLRYPSRGAASSSPRTAGSSRNSGRSKRAISRRRGSG